MNIGGGEAADQLVRMLLSGTEVSVRLGGSALKNLLALTMALAKNNKTLSGKVNLGKMLQETRDLRQFSMTGGGVQQALGLEDIHVIAALGLLGDGPVHRQHGGVASLKGVIQVTELGEGGFQNDALMALQLIVHPHKSGVDLRFRDAAHWTLLRLIIMRPAGPCHISAFGLFAGKYGAALAAADDF